MLCYPDSGPTTGLASHPNAVDVSEKGYNIVLGLKFSSLLLTKIKIKSPTDILFNPLSLRVTKPTYSSNAFANITILKTWFC